jgi:carboxypeptidase Taq
MTTNNLYNEYVQMMQKAADMNNAAAVLSWDQEVYMPAKGAGFRGRQIATLVSAAHEILTSPNMGKLLETLHTNGQLTDIEKANITKSYDDHQKHKKLPHAFVEELSLQTSECFNAWIDARKQNNFDVFAPSLAKMVDLKRRQADLYGYTGHPYDALADEYEPGANVAMLDKLFEGIKRDLPPILAAIAQAPQVSDALFEQHYPKQQQWDFSMKVLELMGYDLEAGRQDISEHPFTTSFAPTDVRVTTRVDENNYASLLWSTIHEGGHALYEQGLPESEYGLPLGSAASLGIHESQSRLWENCVGRSKEFWNYFFPILQNYFATQLSGYQAQDIYKACNKVIPSLIRTEADELTYHFHVLIRYEIEKKLIDGSLATKDLRAAWNEGYQQYLGITPPDDKRGVLQDVHWSHGSFGYFPTYSLGSFYGAQFFAHAQQAIPGLNNHIANGDMKKLLQWLRTNIHCHGRRYDSETLCQKVTGEGLDTNYFLRYVRSKYADIYGIPM